jgi:acetyl-CoA synthetase
VSESQIYKVTAEWKERAHIDAEGYARMYADSIRDPEGFWAEQGKRIDWFKPYTKVKDVNFTYPDVSIRWFHDGVTNVAHNCIDRHLETRADQVAIVWEGDDPATTGRSPIASCTRRCAASPTC